MAKTYKSGKGYSRKDLDAVSDNAEITEEQIVKAKPFAEALPELAASIPQGRGASKTSIVERNPIDNRTGQEMEIDPIKPDIDELDEPSGLPLSNEEIIIARTGLAFWQSPDKFKAAVDVLCDRCASADWFNRPQLKFLHEAFVLARFAQRISADKVRLAQTSLRWPDGFVQISGKAHSVEVTSTHGGRRLGEEYRVSKGLTMDPVEDWVARGDSIPRYLDEAVRAKSQKRYSAPVWLVVYLNISEYGIRQQETELAITQVKAQYQASFEAISVLWKGSLY
jgi:hypothetical protein